MRWILVGIIALCNTVGDVLNTAGMKRQGEAELNPRAVAHMVARIFRNPLVLAGLGALPVAFIALLSLLSVPHVSFAVPATAIGYLLEPMLAKYVPQEQGTWRRWGAASPVASR